MCLSCPDYMSILVSPHCSSAAPSSLSLSLLLCNSISFHSLSIYLCLSLSLPLSPSLSLLSGQFSLLGLGDIVIPGLFVALLLRFDAVRNKISAVNADHASFSKPFFTVNLICYALGLVATVGVMYFFNAAQPALLYLVPACLGGSLAVGVYRGELNLLLAYDEESKEKDKDTVKADTPDDSKKATKNSKKAN
jgi:Signal peptide peptidase